jgi:hypothetical protein
MRNDLAKESREREVFQKFASSSGHYDLATIESRRPPEPDIYCVHREEGPVAFELVELCSPVMAAAAASLYDGYLRVGDPTSDAIRKKLTTSYSTHHPVELLCYVAGRIVTPDSHIRLRIRSFSSRLQRKYRRVWLLGRKGVCEVCKTV